MKRIPSDETLGKRVKFATRRNSLTGDFISQCQTCNEMVLTLSERGPTAHNRAKAEHRSKHVREFLDELYRDDCVSPTWNDAIAEGAS
jgi:hypothetical protein